MSLVYRFEQLCEGLRHSPLLRKAVPVWNKLRPLYESAMGMLASDGLVRQLNGTDTIKLCAECRGIRESYEPEVWAKVMSHVKAGSKVIDVGAHVGLYATAFGLRVSPSGKVLAVEPDPENLVRLGKHMVLNDLKNVVTVVQAGLSDAQGTASLSMDSLQSHVTNDGQIQIKLETLDTIVGSDDAWDLMLIDVEGHEEKVLRGGPVLLASRSRRPTMILIEVHPYAWAGVGASSAGLLGLLKSNGYNVTYLDGSAVNTITDYGHIVATVARD